MKTKSQTNTDRQIGEKWIRYELQEQSENGKWYRMVGEVFPLDVDHAQAKHKLFESARAVLRQRGIGGWISPQRRVGKLRLTRGTVELINDNVQL